MGSTEKKSEQVYRYLLSYIDENKFSGNQKLPSENALCRRLKVSRETVRAAQEKLAEDGLIRKVQGSGTYFNREAALSYDRDDEHAIWKIGMILQGQDRQANSGMIEGARSVLPLDQIDLHVFLTDNKFSNERRCLQTVVHQNFHGFIVDGVKASLLNPNLDCYQEICRRRIPIIFYNNYYKNLDCPKVIVDDKKCAEQLIGRLILAGHRHIAGIFVYDNYQSIEKFQGMTATMRKYGVAYQDDYIKWCVSNEAHDQRFVKEISRFLKSLSMCTAVVCCNYIIYRLVRQALANMGKGVPEDYSVVCFDYSGEDWAKEGVTCSVHQGFQMGVEVATRLMKMIRSGRWDGNRYTYVMEPKIVEGSSIRNL